MHKTPEEVKKLLKTVFDHFDQEDRSVREFQLRQWKKLKCYWDSLFNIYWSSTAHDYRSYDLDNASSDNADYAYDKPINIFKADLETIIAALSVQIPGVKAYPDDADNPADLETAKAGDSIAKILYRHNDVPLLWLHALFIYCTEGLIAGYTKTKESDSYGTYTEDEYEEVEEGIQVKICPLCKTNIQDQQLSDALRDEFDPEDVFSQSLLSEGTDFCAECLDQVTPEIREQKVLVPRIVGVTSNPKSRQCMEVYGGLFVKVPVYAKTQADCPYLIFSEELHYSKVIDRFAHLNAKFDRDGNWTGASSQDHYEIWARLSTQYRGEEPRNLVTVRTGWLRPSSFNVIPDKDDVKKLKKLYPNGVRVTFVQDEWAEDKNEALDDHWTLSKNPLADYLHHQPLGQLLTSVQEVTNDLISLTLQTIEHGIPQTFFDQAILDGKTYSETEIRPGMLIPVKAAAGKSVEDSFHEIKTAILSSEVLPFSNKIQELGQFVSGAMPSLFGGAAEGSKTAAEYSMSRAQALQRLQTPWKMLSIWWKHMMSKSINGYIKNVAHDERIVEKDKTGNLINVFVRRAQLVGKIGDIELETAEQLPVTWGQNKDAVLQLMQSQNPGIMEALADPENIPTITSAIGMPDFKIPGEDDRTVQYEEIRQLLDSEPIIGISPETGMEEEQPSVNIEPLVDNNIIHSDICRRFLISPAGRLAKIENAEGYKNILLHMERHIQVIQAMQMMNAAPSATEDPTAKPEQEPTNV